MTRDVLRFIQIWHLGEPAQGRLGPVPTGLYNDDHPTTSIDNDEAGPASTPRQHQPLTTVVPTSTTTHQPQHRHTDNYNLQQQYANDHKFYDDNTRHPQPRHIDNGGISTPAHQRTDYHNDGPNNTTTIKTATHRQPQRQLQRQHVDNGDTPAAAISTHQPQLPQEQYIDADIHDDDDDTSTAVGRDVDDNHNPLDDADSSQRLDNFCDVFPLCREEDKDHYIFHTVVVE
ncbi:hypothetical protein EDB84DRAFT_1439815 [Lactarius hengduanensis]|nr:hypothetical protein EDB84DRAFT_1439815 [Lactarius hengduanensis]